MPTPTQIVATQDVATAIQAPHVRPLRRQNAVMSMLMFCRIPADPDHLEPGMRGEVADWGKVTSVAPERGEFDGDAVVTPIITIAGHRGRYRIESEVGVMGNLEVNAGDTVALCADREPSDLYHYPGGPTLPIITAFPVTGEPQLAEPKRLHALYTRDIDLAAQGSTNRVSMAGDRKYFLLATAKGKRVDNLIEMDRWFLDMPASMAGADQVLSGKPTWLIVEHPELISATDGGKPRFVVHAVEAIPEVLP